MLLAMLFSFLLFDNGAEPPPYYLVMTNKKVMKVKVAPKIQGKLATITLLDGKMTSLPARMIDLAETEKYNQRVADKAESDRLAAEAKAAVEAQLEVKRAARRKKKQESLRKVELRADDELPKYERPNNTQVETAAAVGQPTGDAQVNNFTSDDPVFVAQETIRSYDNRTEIICKVKVQATKGAFDIKVKLTVRYSKAAAGEIEQRIDGALAYNQTGTVTFRLNQADTVVATFYEVSATVNQ